MPRVMSHTSVGHVTHINELCMTHGNIGGWHLHATSHDAYISESCYTHECLMYDTQHISESYYTHEWHMYDTQYISESCHTHEWLMYDTQQTTSVASSLHESRVTMHTAVGHVTYMNELYMTHSNNILCLAMPRVKCDTSVVITYINESCHTHMSYRVIHPLS